MGKARRFLWYGALVVFLVAAHAMAVEAGGEAHHGPNWTQLIYMVVNFAILLYLLVKLGRGPMKEFFANRHHVVADSVSEAEQLNREARERNERIKERLATMEREMEELLASMKRDGQAMRERIVQSAKEEGERLRRDALRAVEQEIRASNHRLQVEMVDIAMAMARQMMVEKITPADRNRMAEEYMKKFSAMSSELARYGGVQ